MTRRALLRVLDANANRALEGLRVCEEIVRFHLASPKAFRAMRTLRHGVAGALRALPMRPVELVRSRQSQRDIGRRARSQRAASLEHVLVMNFQRAKESLRTLEECARLVAPRHAAAFQALRFRAYDAERDVLLNLAALRHR